MIDEALIFLKKQLNNYMQASLGLNGAQPEPVAFIDGDRMEPLTFVSGAVSLLLVNLEEEYAMRDPDPYRRVAADGSQQVVHPPIRLNLYLLFVARYSKYTDALRNLSLVIRFFQSHRLFTQSDSPGLSETIERLTVELITMPFAQQNEVWNSLRVSYHPSVLYRVKMIVFQDEHGFAAPVISEPVINRPI
jgi:hypothetical protein